MSQSASFVYYTNTIVKSMSNIYTNFASSTSFLQSSFVNELFSIIQINIPIHYFTFILFPANSYHTHFQMPSPSTLWRSFKAPSLRRKPTDRSFKAPSLRRKPTDRSFKAPSLRREPIDRSFKAPSLREKPTDRSFKAPSLRQKPTDRSFKPPSLRQKPTDRSFKPPSINSMLSANCNSDFVSSIWIQVSN
jgi:hypothetical protein